MQSGEDPTMKADETHYETHLLYHQQMFLKLKSHLLYTSERQDKLQEKLPSY